MNKEFISEFIEVYRQHPSLWKVKSAEYINKNLKVIGLTALMEVCTKFKFPGDREFVKKKIQSLRSTFRKECNKVERSIRSGRGSDEVYSPNLWYFDLMLFLKDQDQPSESLSNMESHPYTASLHEEHEEEEEDVVVNNDVDDMIHTQENNSQDELQVEHESQVPSPSTSQTINTSFITQKRQQRKRQKKEETTNEHRNFLKACTSALINSNNSVSDDSEAFGTYVGKKLKSITAPAQQMYAETLITQVLQRAIMNTLSETTILIDRQRPPHMTYTSPQYGSNNNNNVPVNMPMPSTSTDESQYTLQQYYSTFTN